MTFMQLMAFGFFGLFFLILGLTMVPTMLRVFGYDDLANRITPKLDKFLSFFRMGG